MLLTTKNNQVNTEELEVANDISTKLIRALRENPEKVESLSFGHVIPLGGLVKDWGNTADEFNGSYGLFVTDGKWFRNISWLTYANTYTNDYSGVYKIDRDREAKNLDVYKFFEYGNGKVKNMLGQSWEIVAIGDLIKSSRLDYGYDNIDELYEIVNAALESMENGTYDRDIFTVKLGACESIATNIIKIVDRNPDREINKTELWDQTVYEFNYYDEFAGQMMTGTYEADIDDRNVHVFRNTTTYKVPVIYKYVLVPYLADISNIKDIEDINGSCLKEDYNITDDGFSFRLILAINEGLQNIQYVGFPQGYDFSASFKAKYSR